MDSIIEYCKKDNQFCHLEDGYLNWFPCKGKGGLTADNLREIANYLDEQNAEHHAGIIQFFLDNKIKERGYKVYINNKLNDCVPTEEKAWEVIGNAAFGSLYSVSHTDPDVDVSSFI
jgi:hypothetical protein